MTAKGCEATVDRKTRGWKSEKTVRDICRSLQDRQRTYVWIGAGAWKRGLGNMTVKPYRQTDKLQLQVVTLHGTNLTATGSNSGLRSN